jgi:hypothetical protein
MKPSDRATGPLVEALAFSTGAMALVAMEPWPGNSNADPLENCVFKQRVCVEIASGRIHSVIDIHGMTDGHGADICIGTALLDDSVLAQKARGLFEDAGMVVAMNDPFGARGPGTVTRVAQEHGAEAIQIEACYRLRVGDDGNGDRAFFEALCELVTSQIT